MALLGNVITRAKSAIRRLFGGKPAAGAATNRVGVRGGRRGSAKLGGGSG